MNPTCLAALLFLALPGVARAIVFSAESDGAASSNRVFLTQADFDVGTYVVLRHYFMGHHIAVPTPICACFTRPTSNAQL